MPFHPSLPDQQHHGRQRLPVGYTAQRSSCRAAFGNYAVNDAPQQRFPVRFEIASDGIVPPLLGGEVRPVQFRRLPRLRLGQGFWGRLEERSPRRWRRDQDVNAHTLIYQRDGA